MFAGMDAQTFLKTAEVFDPQDREAFAMLLREARHLTRRTLYDFAQEFRTGAGNVSRWEHGHSAPPAVAREAIVKRLKKHVRRLLVEARADEAGDIKQRQHGTPSMYEKGGCRCDPCREAHTKYQVAWRRSKR